MCTDNTQETKTYTVKEVIQLIGVNKDTITRMIRDGRLEAKKVKNRYQITEESIKKLVKEGRKKHDR